MQMTTNDFLRRLRAGEVQYGIFSGLTDTVAAEICAGAGFDWLLFDSEHAPNDLRTLLHQIQAVAASGTPVLVRPESHDASSIPRLLDLGVQTLLAPMVETADQAASVVASVRYPPAGVRGLGSSLARASRWNRIDGYVDRADDEMCVVVQIESVAGMEAIESIAAVDGVDALFVGPADLGASMGLAGRAGHPDVVAAVDDAIRRIVATGTPAGVFATSPERARRCVELGATVVAVGVDLSVLAGATSALAASFRHDDADDDPDGDAVTRRR